MASEKISALGALGTSPDVADLLVMVDVSDLTMAASGTTKNMTVANLRSAFISGTANRATMFTGTNTIGDSTWAFSGNTIYPVTDGSDIGLTGTNRIGTIYMASTLDYAANLIFSEAGTERARMSSGNLLIGTTSTLGKLTINSTSASEAIVLTQSASIQTLLGYDTLGGYLLLYTSGSPKININNPATAYDYINTTRNFIFGAGTASARVHVVGNGSTSATHSFKAEDSSANLNFYVRDDGAVNSRLGYWVEDIKFLHGGASGINTGKNVAVGEGALVGSITGLGGNVAVGHGAGANLTGAVQGNVILGYGSMSNATTSNNNISIGISAGYNITSAGGNVLVGYFAGGGLTTGGNNTVLGASTSLSAGNHNFSIALGYGTVISSSNSFNLGGAAGTITNMYLGKGQYTTLPVSLTMQVSGITPGTTDTDGGNFIIAGSRGTGTGLGGAIVFSVAPAGTTGSTQNALVEAMRITQSKTVAIGTASPSTSAVVDITSTTQGFLPPRMTGAQAEAISSPAEGLMIYSTDGSGATITSKGWWGYEGSTWVKLN